MEALNKLASKVGLGKKEKSAPEQNEQSTRAPSTRPACTTTRPLH